jgi:hypothetical protein
LNAWVDEKYDVWDGRGEWGGGEEAPRSPGSCQADEGRL